MYLKEFPKESALKALAKKYPDLNQHSLESVFWVFRFASELEKALEAHLALWGLSRSRFLLLILLYHSSADGLNPSDLAEKLDVTRGNVTGVINTLEKAGLIERKMNSSDRRCFIVKITSKGTRLIERILPEHFKRINKAFEVLSRKDFKTLLDILTKLEKRLVHISKST